MLNRREFNKTVAGLATFLGLPAASLANFKESTVNEKKEKVDWRVEEIKKCSKDFEHFCSYLKVPNPFKGYVPLKLYDFQKEYFNCLEKDRFCIGVKPRSVGHTSLNCAYSLWKMFFKEKRCMIVTSSPLHVSNTFRFMYHSLPQWLRMSAVEPLTSKGIFDHSPQHELGWGKLNICSPQSMGYKGQTIHYLFVDEPAYMYNMDQNWKIMFPMLSSGACCSIISSVTSLKHVKGERGDWFMTLYEEAKRKENLLKVFDYERI
jgi:hypothetical protein